MTLSIILLTLAATTQTQAAEMPAREAHDPGPLRIMWDLAPGTGTEPFLDWMRDRGWCWGIEAPADAPETDYQRVLSRGMKVVPQLHAHPTTRAWHWSRKGKATPDLAKTVATARAFSGGAPIMQMFMEDDSAGVGFSARLLREKPASYGKAKEMWDLYLEEAMTEVRPFKDLTVWGMIGFARSAHDYGRHGIDCVLVERSNDDIEDLQTAIAFARGASRQFGNEWGIDLSLWWGVFYGCVPDLNASLYTRHLWVSFLSGAQAYRIEGGAMHYGPTGPGAVAKAIDGFGMVAKSLDRGAPEVPVAVMLAEDHGWMTPAYWRTQNEAWNYARIPYRQGDRGIDGFFGAAYPGNIYAMDPYPLGAYKMNEPAATPFALSSISPDFAPTPAAIYDAEPPVPFGKYESRDAARKDFLENRIDPSPYRPMGDSRWGDIFDVLTADAAPEVLRQYPVLVLLGQFNGSSGLKERLAEYVRQGGRLIWAAGQATPDDAALCGAAIQPELRVGRAWSWRGDAPKAEAYRYCPVSGLAAGAEILAKSQGGEPVVLRNELGEGAVYTVLAPWFESGHAPLADFAERLFDEIFAEVQPVKVDGLPVEWLSTRGRGHHTVLVANHDGQPWQGAVQVRRLDPALIRCLDLIAGGEVVFDRDGDGVKLSLEVPPYGVRVIRWTK